MKNQNFSVEELFGPELKKLRSGISQRELADRMVAAGHASWMQSTVAKTEATENRRPLRLDEFVTICTVLGEDPVKTLDRLCEQEPESEEIKAVREILAKTREVERILASNIRSVVEGQRLVDARRRELDELRQRLDEIAPVTTRPDAE